MDFYFCGERFLGGEPVKSLEQELNPAAVFMSGNRNNKEEKSLYSFLLLGLPGD